MRIFTQINWTHVNVNKRRGWTCGAVKRVVAQTRKEEEEGLVQR